MNSHDTTLTTKQERGIILTKGSVFMKKLKKWQKIVIGVLVALIVVIGGLKIFKRPILSAVLSEDEQMAYDAYIKCNRALKHTGELSTAKQITLAKSLNEDVQVRYIFISYQTYEGLECRSEVPFILWHEPCDIGVSEITIYGGDPKDHYCLSCKNEYTYRETDFYNFDKDGRIVVFRDGKDISNFNDAYSSYYIEICKFNTLKIKALSLL